MISYLEFKKWFDICKGEPEIEIIFKNRKYTYMIIKYKDYITFQRCGDISIQSGEIRFSSLDELYHTKTIDNIILKEEWENIEDMIFDSMFCITEDKEEWMHLLKNHK